MTGEKLAEVIRNSFRKGTLKVSDTEGNCLIVYSAELESVMWRGNHVSISKANKRIGLLCYENYGDFVPTGYIPIPITEKEIENIIALVA